MSQTVTAVVTGAAGALGAAVATELSSRGLRVALVDSPRAAARLKDLAGSLGANARGYEADLAEKGAWSSLLPRIEKDLGVPSAAALIAGGWQGGKPFHEDADDAVWDAMMQMNLETARLALRALTASMVARGSGSIVVIGSRAVERPWTSTGAAAYATSKAALVALAQTVAAEVVQSGVRINAVMPSTLDTPANRSAMPNADPGKWVATASASKVIAFLLSDDAKDVSGAAIPLYGKA